MNKKKNYNIYFVLLLFSSFIISSCVSVPEIVDFFNENDGNRDNPKSDQALSDAFSSIETAIEDITPVDAYCIGRNVAASVLRKYQLYDSFEATEYVNKICSVLTINSADPYLYKGYFVAILDTDEINAIATPGGHIFVTKGLLKCTTSEDAVASVIAHELSHIQLKHSISAIKSSRVVDAVLKIQNAIIIDQMEESNISDFLIEKGIVISQAGDEIISTLFDSGFSITQELAADVNALKMMCASGYEPNAMIDMLYMLENNLEETQMGWSKTHPAPIIRIKNVERSLKKKYFHGKSKSVRQKRFEEFLGNL